MKFESKTAWCPKCKMYTKQVVDSTNDTYCMECHKVIKPKLPEARSPV